MIAGYGFLTLTLDKKAVIKSKDSLIDIGLIFEQIKHLDADPRGKEMLARLVAIMCAQLREVAINQPDKLDKILDAIYTAIINDNRFLLVLTQIIQENYIKQVIEPELDIDSISREVEANKNLLKGAREFTYEAYVFGSEPGEKERALKLSKVVRDPKFDPVKSAVLLDSYNESKRLNRVTSFAAHVQADPVDKAIYEQIKGLKVGEFSEMFEITDLSGGKVTIIIRLLGSTEIQISSQTGIELAMRSALDKKAGNTAIRLMALHITDSRLSPDEIKANKEEALRALEALENQEKKN